MIKLTNNKEDVNVNKMYGMSSTISKEEFIAKYNINPKRTYF